MTDPVSLPPPYAREKMEVFGLKTPELSPI